MFFRKKKAAPEDPQDLIARKEYRKAISIYLDRISKDPKDYSSRLGLAETYLLERDVDLALKQYKKLAECYTQDGFMVKAIAVYKRMLKLRPDDKQIEALLANLSERRTLETEAAQETPAPVPSLEIETKLFRDLTPEELRQIIEKLSLRHYEEDTIVVQEGEPGDSLFIVVRGEVRVLTRDPDQKEVVLGNLGEGEFFGEVALLTGKPRTATIVTNTGSELLELTRKDYVSIVAKYPHLKKVMEDFHLQRAYKTIEAMVQAYRANLE